MRAWLDRAAIQDVILRYTDSVTRGDWEQTAALFAADAIWECPALELRFEGPQAYLEFLRSTFTEQAVLLQTAHGSVIDLTGTDAAKARTTVHEIVRSATADSTVPGAAGGAINVAQYGVYFDELERVSDGWKFTHRHFVPLYIESDAATGHSMIRRPLLPPARA